MRVFQLVTHFDLGGAERVALNIARSKGGIEYHMIEVAKGSGDFAGAFVREMEECGIRYHRSPISSNKAAILLFPFRLQALVMRFHPDVLHTHTEVPDLGLYLWSIIFGWMYPGIRIVKTIHNTELWNSWKGIGRHAERLFIRNTPVAISRSTMESYRLNYGVSAAIISNGLEEVPQTAFEGIEPGKTNILFAGRFEAQKGIDVLCEVVRNLSGHPGIVFHIVGSGSMSDMISELKDLPNVRIYDKIFGLSGHLSSFSYLFMPSIHEGLSLMSIEASLAGLPAIINPCPGLDETLPEDWPLAARGNTAECFIDIFTHLDRYDHDSLAGYAYRYAKEHFSIETMQRQYESVYGFEPNK